MVPVGLSPEDTESMLLESAHRKVESQHNVIEQLEQKCAVLLGFALVSVVEVLGFLLLVAADHGQRATSEPFWVHAVFYSALGLVLLGGVVGLGALRGNASYYFHASDFRSLREKASDKAAFLHAMLDGVEEAISGNWRVIRHKRIELRVSSVFVGIALFFYAILVGRIFSSRF
jgi:hypothetical protein